MPKTVAASVVYKLLRKNTDPEHGAFFNDTDPDQGVFKTRIRAFSMIQIRIRAFSMIQIRIRVFSMILIRIRAFSMIQIRITQRHIPGGLGTVLLLTCSKSDQVRQNDADPTGSGFATLVSTLILLTLYSFPKPIFLSYCCFLYTDKTVRKSIKSVLKISNCKLM